VSTLDGGRIDSPRDVFGPDEDDELLDTDNDDDFDVPSFLK
jgi:hypothetical protein